MALEIASAKRVFEHNSITITDPNPNLSLDEVKKHLSGLYPEILNSKFEGPTMQEDGTALYKVKSEAGTFG